MAYPLQTTASECGLACLAGVASDFGHEVELAELRARFSLSLRGATLADLMQIASVLGFASRPLRLELDELDQLKTPCILHWDLNHFVVLLKATAKGILIHDPAQGERKVSLREASEHFTGVALELSPSDGFRRQKAPPPIGWRQLVGRAVGWKRSLAQMLLLAAALEVFALISPFFVQWIVDGAIVSGDKDLLTLLGLGFLLLQLLTIAITAARSWVMLALSTQLNVQWSARVMGHLIRLPMKYFETRHIGDIVSRFQSLNTIQQTLTGSLVEALLDGVFAAMTLALMFVYSAKLAVVALVAIALYAVLRIASYAPLRRASGEYLAISAREQTHFLESLRGVQSVKLGGQEEKRRAKWLNLLVQATNRHVSTAKMAIGFRTINSLLFSAESLITLWWGALLAMDNLLSVGMLLAFISYKDSFSGRMSGFIDKAIDLRMLNLQVERLADIVLTNQEKLDGSLPLALDTASLIETNIEFEDVSFRYGEREPWVLRHLNLKIEAGEHVAIVGPSGCGKSTLVKLLLGLAEPSEGVIKVGGLPLSQLGAANWRKLLGVVMQDDQLFSGSLQDNIANFDDRIDLARVQASAELAAVHEDIVKMPMGFHTLIGDMGSSLSGGQKQRLLLARALYRQPKVLVLDEATSHLDVARERLVNDSIAGLSLTRISIAHRPETIAMANRIINLEKKIVLSELTVA
ncbi:peptidase domain-containing ABC transporter [Niveibacterium terrae]|uniref:peptidase domain-containing ABC transporter n=1 Tax=Niveibacterium terrae TaxID=3373598 RepID=UPI003A932A66